MGSGAAVEYDVAQTVVMGTAESRAPTDRVT